LLSTGCEEEETGVLMKMAFMDTETYDGSYYVVIHDNSTISISVGLRKNNSLRTRKFLKSIDKSAEAELSAEDFNEICRLAEAIREDPSGMDARDFTDGRDVALLYGGEEYKTEYWHNNSLAFGELIEKIRQLSPITIDLERLPSVIAFDES
jgi:hypothetical protein